MGLKDTGTVNDAATAGAGRGTGSRGTPITRDPWDTGPRNPNSFFGPGQGSNYVPAKIGAYATPEPYLRNKTELKITLTPDPVSGGGVIPALTLVGSRPGYIPEAGELAKNFTRMWVTWGYVNDKLPTNWKSHEDISLSKSVSKDVWIKADLASTAASATLTVTSCKWFMQSSGTAPVNPPWGSDNSRPSHVHILLGTVMVANGVAYFNNAGGGSVQIAEYVSSITAEGSLGFKYQKSLSFQRT